MDVLKANFDTTLRLIADRFSLNVEDLRDFSVQDPHDGWDEGRGSWPVGSLWTVEGVTLYTLIRALNIKGVIEIGAFRGASTTHIAQALLDNGGGKVYSVDIAHGPKDQVPEDLLPYIEYVEGDGVAYLNKRWPKNVTLVFEDGSHSREQVGDVWKVATRKIAAGGMVISHDGAHFLVGEAVRAGIEDAGITDALTVLTSPSDCGLSIWMKEG